MPSLCQASPYSPSPTQVSDRINAAIFQQNQIRDAEAGQDIDIETAVSVEHTGIVSIHFQALLVHDKHGNFCSILAVEEDLLRLVSLRIKINGRLAEDF